MDQVISDDQLVANLAENVQRLLRERGMSQTDLARESGVNQMTISRICNGKHTPSAGVVARLAEALRTSMDWLVTSHEENSRRSA